MCESVSKSIGIIGAGAFGTALSIVYHKKHNVTLFSCFDDHVNCMKESHRNEFLKDFLIPEDIEIDTTSNLQGSCYDCILWVLPIKPTPNILAALKERIYGKPIVICSKGLLHDSSFVCDLFKNELPDSQVGYLAGPNFAVDLAQNKFSMADIAFNDIQNAKLFSNILSTDTFKLNAIDDMKGAQISGAFKNVVSIACGIAYGLNLGENAHSALLTLAIAEMVNFGCSLGAKKETFYGLCGLGDLVMTASNKQSRNTSLGIAVASGKNISDCLNSTTCEGYDTIKQLIMLAMEHNIEIPICQRVYEILFDNKDPNSIVDVFK